MLPSGFSLINTAFRFSMFERQISEELNFPSQSFFGKYFKRVVGVAPKEYKRK
jgi:YesN/AraC family two-component response regulator